MNTEELKANAEKLAKEKYQENYFAALWGSASCFLSDEQFKTIARVMEK
jgi:hypothetical protein